MSKQIKASEKSPQTDRKNDFPLDKYLFRAATYGLTGFGVGLATSLFFKHKVPITAFFTGAGTGLGLQGVTQDWQSYERNKSWVKNQTQQRYSRGDDDDDSKGDRDSDNVNFDKYAQAQRNQEWSRLGQQKNEQKRGDQKEQDKDSSSKFERQDQKSNQEKADNQRQKRDQKEQDKDSSFKFERQGQKPNQEKADNQRQKRDQKEQDKDSSAKFERQDHKSNQEKADNQRQKRDQKEQDKDSSAKFERQAQQGKHEGKLNEQQGQQSKQQGQQARRQQDKEEPLNPEAQYKKDIADRWTDFNKPLEKPEPKMGQGHDDYPFSQDKRKREEDTVYSQSMQGAEGGANEISRGEKGPQNSRIPPSQRDWTGGHANKGVQQQQVHRGAPEADKLGKSPRPDTEPNKNPDRGAPQQGNQALSNVDFKGQNLQTFQSNPLVLGKAGLTHEIQKNYQQGRNRANDPNLDNTRRRLDGLEQDIMGKSVKQGILFTQEEKSDTESGVHNYRPVAEQNLKNQVNAVLE